MNLVRSLTKFRDKISPRKLPARVGWQDGTVYNQARPNYIRLHWPDGVQFEAINEGCPGGFGDHVTVVEDPDQPGLLIAYPRHAYFWRDVGYSMMKPHRFNHRWNSFDWTPIELRQFMPLQPSVSGFVLTVRAGWIETTTGLLYFDPDTVDLTANKPTSGARYVLVSISDAGALTVTDGTVKTLFTLTTADIPALPSGHTRVCAVRLYAGQIAVRDAPTNTDLLDFRLTGFGVDGLTADWPSIANIPTSLAEIAGLTFAEGDIIQVVGGALVNRTVAQLVAGLPSIINVAVKTDDYLIAAADDLIVCDKATAMTITLPPATGAGQVFRIKNINTGTVTIDADSAETIDSLTTQDIYQWESVSVCDYGAGVWAII